MLSHCTQAELVLEKATQSQVGDPCSDALCGQEFQLKSRAATAEGSLEVQISSIFPILFFPLEASATISDMDEASSKHRDRRLVQDPHAIGRQ